MGLTFNLGRVSPSVFTDSSLNVGIGAAPSGTYKLEVTGTAKVSSTLLVSGAATFSSTVTTLASTTNGFIAQTTANSVYPYFRWVANNRSYWAAAIDNGSDAPFSIGNGNTIGSSILFSLTPSNNTAYFSGSVGVGTTTMPSKLTVNGTFRSQLSDANDISLSINPTSSGVYVSATYNTTGTYQPMIFEAGGSERMRITSGGVTKKPYINYTEYHASTAYASQNGVISFGNSYNQAGLGDGLIAAYASTLNANPRLYMAVASGGVYLTLNATSWTANSDERLKNINGIVENALDKLCTLRAVNYSWKEDNTNKEYIGLIAQDVQKVLPEVVDINENDEMKTLGVRYTELIPVLVKAIQELKAEIDILKAK